jgi:hypothetical protein
MAFAILKGNSSIPVTILNSNPSVKPTILKGNRISQTTGKMKSRIRASGQHATNSSPHSAIAINVLKGSRIFNL